MHFNFVWPRDCGIAMDAAAVDRLRMSIYRVLVDELQGSFSAEQGIGPYNRAACERFTAPEHLQLAGALQRLVNPHGALGTVDLGPT